MRSKRNAGFVMQMESPHNTPIEWWFFHGSFQAPGKDIQNFMVCFFRYDTSGKASGPFVFSGLVSALDRGSGRYVSSTFVEPAYVTHVLNEMRATRSGRLDRDLVDAFIAEVSRHGPPAPVVAQSKAVRMKSDRLDIKWGDLALRQESRCFALSFRHPDSGIICYFKLEPETPAITLTCDNPDCAMSKIMSCVTYPRLRLTGTAGGVPVKGRGWLDHQWGGLGLFRSDDDDRNMMGWTWLGMNLEDGATFGVSVNRNLQTGELIGTHAGVKDSGGRVFKTEKMTLTPLRWWQSPRTWAGYPVSCRIVVPEFDADLVFEPYADDQEIPVFGPSRAIWEGAGTITGRLQGKKVRGTAQQELHGHACILDFKGTLDAFAGRVDRRIGEFMPKQLGAAKIEEYIGKPRWNYAPDAATAMLSKPAWDLMERKGKRWRPVFVLLMLEALGVKSEPYENLLCQAELSHTGALIIDDIEDSSRIRRGDDCIHVRYGLDVAINAGNWLYFLPLLAIDRHPLLAPDQKRRIHELMTAYYVRAHMGQALDIYWSRNMSRASLRKWMKNGLEGQMLEMYAGKTAAVVIAAAETAAIIAGREDLLASCADFARIVGVSFQIIDDVNNFSDSPEWRKTCGEDLTEGKMTYAIYHALRLLRGREKARLTDILCSPALRGGKKAHAEGVKLIRKSGSLEYCRRKAVSMFERAWRNFEAGLPSSESKILLKTLCSKMIELSRDI